jgi:hypothetical protein
MHLWVLVDLLLNSLELLQDFYPLNFFLLFLVTQRQFIMAVILKCLKAMLA